MTRGTTNNFTYRGDDLILLMDGNHHTTTWNSDQKCNPSFVNIEFELHAFRRSIRAATSKPPKTTSAPVVGSGTGLVENTMSSMFQTLGPLGVTPGAVKRKSSCKPVNCETFAPYTV